jgi:hypothetical protein
MDHTENVSSIIACFLVARETTRPQGCSLATAFVLLPEYTAVTWQQVYMSQYIRERIILFAPETRIKSCILDASDLLIVTAYPSSTKYCQIDLFKNI